MHILMLAAALGSLTLATPGHATLPFKISDIEAPCNHYAGEPVTNFPGGVYRLRGKDVNQRVSVTRKQGGVYTVTAGQSGRVMLFHNGSDTYILRAEVGNGSCTFSLAARSGDTLSIYSAFAASKAVTGSVRDTLPSINPAKNAAFLQSLAPYASARGQLFFVATPAD